MTISLDILEDGETNRETLTFPFLFALSNPVLLLISAIDKSFTDQVPLTDLLFILSIADSFKVPKGSSIEKLLPSSVIILNELEKLDLFSIEHERIRSRLKMYKKNNGGLFLFIETTSKNLSLVLRP